MAAPLGFKTFTTGEVLTAADTNGYLMQGVLVFADAAARSAAITSPQEGQTSYLKDTDEIQVYSGSAWVTKSGGLPSQTGNAGKYLTTDGTNASWGTVSAGGGMTLLSTTTVSGSSTTVSSINQTYQQLYIVYRDIYNSTGGNIISARFNGDTSSVYNSYTLRLQSGNTYQNANDSNTLFDIAQTSSSTTARNKANGSITIERYATSDSVKHAFCEMGGSGGTGDPHFYLASTNYQSTSGISSITFNVASGTFQGGTIYIYGVN